MNIVAINPPENKNIRRPKLGALFSSEPPAQNDVDFSGIRYSPRRNSYAYPDTTPNVSNQAAAAAAGTSPFYSNPNSAYCSPYNNLSSPWSHHSPYTKSPWMYQIVDSSISPAYALDDGEIGGNGLIGSLFREEGHIYSLAAFGDLLYTGSESKNIRVWKNLNEFSGFKSGSGLVKAIVVFSDRVFTGHQDGKIRVWRYLGDKRKTHKRVGNLPKMRDLLMKSINPRNYVKVRRHRNVPWVKHYDAVSCLSVDPVEGLLYSGSWDKTLKVWRISDSKCLESIRAHGDALNSVAVGFDGLVFTGSADGTVKAWRRELVAGSVGHVLVETLLRQNHALTSLAVSRPSAEEGCGGGAVYAGSSDGFVSFWEREKHFMAYGGVLRGHRMAVLCLAASGSLVVSGSADRSICVWRRDGGGAHTCLGVLTGHTGPVKCVAVDRDGGRDGDDKRWIVYSGSLDKSVKVWRVSDGGGGMRELQGE